MEGEEHVVKRIIRYLKGKPRVAIRYGFQEDPDTLTEFTDSDCAGDEKTRRGTSGGVVCRGNHTISWWCKLQANIALSSCEAELNAALKGAIEGLNVQRLAHTLGDELSLELKTDASAARGGTPARCRKGETPSSEAALAARERGRGRANHSEDTACRKLYGCPYPPLGSVRPLLLENHGSVLHPTNAGTSEEPHIWLMLVGAYTCLHFV